jgi:hypothetical protein
MSGMISHTDDWVDVTQRTEQYSGVFDLPTRDDLDALAERDSVKISNGFERFFVRVSGIEGDTVYGRVENHLVGKYDYDYNDTVRFEKRNIFVIRKHAGGTASVKTKATKNTKRMLKLLGIDPAEHSKEAMAMMSILQNR